MASYEEQTSMTDIALSVAPFIGASIYHGREAKMARMVGRVYGGRVGTTPINLMPYGSRRLAMRTAALETKGALNLAKTRGVFRASAWGAAKRSGLMTPLAKIAASRTAGLFFAAWNVAIFAPLIYSGVRGAVNTLKAMGRDTRSLDFGGDYVDTRGAYTERQRSLRAITSSRMSTRAAIGNEALLLHR